MVALSLLFRPEMVKSVQSTARLRCLFGGWAAAEDGAAGNDSETGRDFVDATDGPCHTVAWHVRNARGGRARHAVISKFLMANTAWTLMFLYETLKGVRNGLAISKDKGAKAQQGSFGSNTSSLPPSLVQFTYPPSSSLFYPYPHPLSPPSLSLIPDTHTASTRAPPISSPLFVLHPLLAKNPSSQL
jgi:hypothetical protein